MHRHTSIPSQDCFFITIYNTPSDYNSVFINKGILELLATYMTMQKLLHTINDMLILGKIFEDIGVLHIPFKWRKSELKKQKKTT